MSRDLNTLLEVQMCIKYPAVVIRLSIVPFHHGTSIVSDCRDGLVFLVQK